MDCLKLDSNNQVISSTLERITNEQFVSSLRETWSSDYRQSAFLRDIPRLIKRTQIQTSDYQIKGPFIDDTKVNSIIKTLEVIAMDRNCELDTLQEIKQELECNNLTEDGAIQYIFERLGSRSPLIKILSLINQGTILFAIHILKQDVCRNIMTKDVRTPEGWKIFVRLGDVIQVVHRRIEQSLDEFGDTSNHFEFEWEVLISFDRDLDQLRSATIRIIKLTAAETIDPEYLASLRRTFIEGLIVL